MIFGKFFQNPPESPPGFFDLVNFELEYLYQVRQEDCRDIMSRCTNWKNFPENPSTDARKICQYRLNQALSLILNALRCPDDDQYLFVFGIIEFSVFFFSRNQNFKRNMYRFRRKHSHLFTLLCFAVSKIQIIHADNPLEHLCLGVKMS